MRQSIAIIILIFCVSLGFAQKGKYSKKVNSGKLIEKGIEKYDNSEWEESAKWFEAVPLGDTLYNLAQFELAYSYEKQLRFDEAFAILYRLLDVKDEKLSKSMVYIELANCYSENDKFDKAIQIYDSVLMLYPYNYLIYFNKGTVYQKMELHDSAIKCFEKAIFCNPAYQLSHYQLGLSLIQEKLYIPAVMALNFAAMLYPSRKEALYSLQKISELYSSGFGKNSATNHKDINPELETRNEKYKKWETLVQSEFALNKKYKLKSKINHLLVKQNQFIFENLVHDTNSSFIEDQMYTPFFKLMVKDKKVYNVFCHLILSNTDIEDGAVMKRAQDMDKELEEIWAICLKVMQEAMKNGIGIENKDNYSYEYTNNYQLIAFGPYYKDAKGKRIENGHWFILSNDGYLYKEGDYINGKENGNWYYYDVYGNVIQDFRQLNDSIIDTGYVYFDRNQKENTKLLDKEVPFKNGKVEGIRSVYNRSGFLIEKANWKNELYDGDFFYYYDQGMPKYSSVYKKGELLGTSIEYYPNGDIQSEFVFSEKDKEGTAVTYFPGGKIEKQGAIINHKAVGLWKSYYFSGRLCSEIYYTKDGKETGDWVFYNNNGLIDYKVSYDNGKKNGDELMYNNNGKILYKNVYKNGTLTELITYYPDGKEREKFTPVNKLIVANIYSNDSINDYLYKVVSYKLNGEREGKLLEYAPNGKILAAISYKDNKQNGSTVTYYPNGKMMAYVELINDDYDGLYLRYYENDSLSEEGMYSKGEKTGAWYTYYMNGTIKSLEIYTYDEITYKCEYFMSGLKSLEMNYMDGLPISNTMYNEKGEVIKKLLFENGNGDQSSYYLNGKIESKSKLIAGTLKDTTTWYSFDGKVCDYAYCIAGEYYGVVNIYSDINDSKVRVKSTYLKDKEIDTVNFYNENGKLSFQYSYEYGVTQGIMKRFHFNGNLSVEGNYVSDKRQGVFTYYAIDGKTVIYQLLYDDNQIIAYSYMDKNHKMTDFKPIRNEKIEIVSYYSDGTVSNKVTFENGLRQGKEYAYYPNGKLFEEVDNLDNEYHGMYRRWDVNGKLIGETEFLYGYLHGKSNTYFEYGNVSQQAEYIYGLLNGEVKRYDKNGKLILEQLWYYGNRLK